MFKTFTPLAAAAAVFLTAAIPAAAQSLLTPAQIIIQRYDQIPNFDGDTGLYCCATHVIESGQGSDFYHIRVVFNVAFSEDVDRVSVNSRDITIAVPGEEDGLRAIGRFDYMPIFEYGSPSIFARRPRDFPEVTEQAFLDAVWQVPTGVTSTVLTVGEEGSALQIPLDLNQPMANVMRPSQTVTVAVTGFTAEQQLTLGDRSNGQDVAARVTPNGAQALRLDIDVTPTMSTSTDAQAGENQFFMYSDYFALIGPSGLPLMPLGYRVNDSLRQNWSISSSWDNAPRTSDMTLYFLGNPDLGTYTVYYLSDPVAAFNLQ